MNFAMLPNYYIVFFCRYTAYRQCLLTKAATLIFCTEFLETQVATLSMIN